MATPKCIFCDDAKCNAKVFIEGAFLTKDNTLVDRYRGVAHMECIDEHAKQWEKRNQWRTIKKTSSGQT